MFSWRAFGDGVRATFPLLPGVITFSAVFGTMGASKGLTIIETMGMSFFVYAGLSQMMGMQLWQEVWSFSSLLSVMLVVFAVNLRMVLMGAALHPHLSQLKPHQAYSALLTMTDANFLLTVKYQKEGGTDTGYFIGAGAILWLVWMVFNIPGYYATAMLGDVKRFGFDLFLPIFFGAMAVNLFEKHRDYLLWTIAAGVSLTASYLLEGYWYIVIGAISASLIGGFYERAE